MQFTYINIPNILYLILFAKSMCKYNSNPDFHQKACQFQFFLLPLL